MNKFIYEGFACTEANEEEVVFSRNGGEIRMENRQYLCKLTPMKKYTLSLVETTTKVNTFLVKSFMLDKFNNFIVVLCNSNTQNTVEIKMPLDSYKNGDMESFSIGKTYDVKIE